MTEERGAVFSKCGPQTSSITIIWGLLREQTSQAPRREEQMSCSPDPAQMSLKYLQQASKSLSSQEVPEFEILPSLFPQYWDYRHVTP